MACVPPLNWHSVLLQLRIIRNATYWRPCQRAGASLDCDLGNRTGRCGRSKRGRDMRYPCDCGCRRARVAPSRRSFIAGWAASAVVPAAALAQAAAPASSEDVRFMRMALEEARQG